MKERIIEEGTDFMAFEVSGEPGAEVYKPIAGQTSCEISDDSDQREQTSKETGNGADYGYGRERWSASVDLQRVDQSNVDANAILFEDLEDVRKAKTKIDLFFCWVTDSGDDRVPDLSKRSYRGKALIKLNSSFPDGENASGSLSLQGCGELAHVAPV